MLANNCSHGDVTAAQQRIWKEAGANADGIIQRLNDDPAFCERLVAHALIGAFTPTASQLSARKIMGEHMFDLLDVLMHLNMRPTNAELESLDEVPFSKQKLRQLRRTHMLIPIFPRSLEQFYRIFSGTSPGGISTVIPDSVFSNRWSKPRWVLIRIGSYPGSEEKSYDDQCRETCPELVASALEVISAVCMYWIKKEQYFLKPGDSVRCRDWERSARITVGIISRSGSHNDYRIFANHTHSDEARLPSVGIATVYYGLNPE